MKRIVYFSECKLRDFVQRNFKRNGLEPLITVCAYSPRKHPSKCASEERQFGAVWTRKDRFKGLVSNGDGTFLVCGSNVAKGDGAWLMAQFAGGECVDVECGTEDIGAARLRRVARERKEKQEVSHGIR